MRIVLLLGAALFPTAAAAQTTMTIPNDAQRNFCIYNNRVFSVGSLICIGNGRGEICEIGDGNAARARWARSRDPEVAEACLDVRPEPIK